MKKLFLLISLTFSLLQGNGQVKTNFDLAKRIESPSTELVHVFIQGTISEIKNVVEAHQGTFYYSSGNIAAAAIPTNELHYLLESNAVKRIEALPQKWKPLNDTMLVNSNVIPVHNGDAPLPQAFDGSGVVVGFIDTGIDFQHPDFKDAMGNSRIQFLWDQTQPVAANTPLPYGYGQEWDHTQIDAGAASAHSDVPYSGHGTHVAGVGVGNGLATGNYKGVAPGADIIMVAVDFNSSNSGIIADAVHYIYSKANLLGKPCVINASLGDYFGSHDGLDLQSQLIASEISAQPGRLFVAACGNGGTTPYHLGHTVNSDTSFSFFQGSSSIYIPVYGDTAQLRNIQFSIGADKISPAHQFRGNIPFSNVISHLGILHYDTLYNGSNRLGVIASYGDQVNGVYSLEFQIIPDSSAYLWRLMSTGSGKFDCWTFDLYDGPLPGISTMPDSAHCVLSDLNETIVSGFNCLDNVISVGNYTNRKTYLDYNNNLFVNTATNPGVLHPTSSRGPTRDGRIKPDICAPGDMTLAACVLSLVPGIISSYPDALAQGGFHVRDGGTSHAAPGVAGIGALYLQRYPNATPAQFKQDLLCSAKQDSFTGSALPNNQWGYGKANAFGTLTGCVITEIPAEELPDPTVFPNPVKNDQELVIRFATSQSNVELTVFDQLGQRVLHRQIQGIEARISLNLPAGIYSIRLCQKGKPDTIKKMVIL